LGRVYDLAAPDGRDIYWFIREFCPEYFDLGEGAKEAMYRNLIARGKVHESDGLGLVRMLKSGNIFIPASLVPR